MMTNNMDFILLMIFVHVVHKLGNYIFWLKPIEIRFKMYLFLWKFIFNESIYGMNDSS